MLGGNVYLNMIRKTSQKSKVSLWFVLAHEVVEITHSHGITFL